MVIRYEGSYLSKSRPWYDFPAEKLRYDIEVGSPLETPPQESGRRQQRRAIASALQAHFDRALVAPKQGAVGSLPDVRHAHPAESGAH